MLRIISFTAQGCDLARRIAAKLPAMVYGKFHTEPQPEDGLQNETSVPSEVRMVTESLSDWAAEGFLAGDSLLFIGAAGIAVRAIAGSVKNKLTDVPVLVMDVMGHHVIPLLSGHWGGANALALQLADLTGAEPVITTATDQTGAFAADLFAKEYRMKIRNPKLLPRISGKAVAGEVIRVAREDGVPGNYVLPEGTCSVSSKETADLRITVRPLSEKEQEETLFLTPQCIVAGIGCRKGIPAEQLETFLRERCEEAGYDPAALAGIASIDVKKEEPAILAVAEKLGIPFVTYTAEELRAVPGEFTESAFVAEHVGVGEVSGRAAARMAVQMGRQLPWGEKERLWEEGAEEPKYRMLLWKATGEGITLSLACSHEGQKTIKMQGKDYEETKDRFVGSSGR